MAILWDELLHQCYDDVQSIALNWVSDCDRLLCDVSECTHFHHCQVEEWQCAGDCSHHSSDYSVIHEMEHYSCDHLQGDRVASVMQMLETR